MSGVASMSLEQIAARMGGAVKNGPEGRFALVPGPGHTRKDRSLSISLDPSAPDGFLVNSFAGDDPILCRDYFRREMGAPAFKPNGKGKRATAAPAISMVSDKAAKQARLKRP